jgi:hypothetical protein
MDNSIKTSMPELKRHHILLENNCNPSCVSEKITMSSAYIRQSTLLLLTFTELEAFLKISGKSFKNN